MQIEKNKVVSIDYTLTDSSGELLDSSAGKEPLSYIHGTGSLIPGLESVLEGKGVGDELQVSVPPEDGYGVRDEALISSVRRDQLKELDSLQEGVMFGMEDDSGTRIYTIVKIEDETVTVDGNHPLAGKTLNFAVTVQEVREASDEELDHGHVHGGHDHGHGGHDHGG
jgi:FKBP-type peptidyl-prolyl cis-trans isomerase SlyD